MWRVVTQREAQVADVRQRTLTTVERAGKENKTKQQMEKAHSRCTRVPSRTARDSAAVQRSREERRRWGAGATRTD